MFFVQITNQIVSACKNYIQQYTCSEEDEDLLWDTVQYEILYKDPGTGNDLGQHLFKEELEGKLRVMGQTQVSDPGVRPRVMGLTHTHCQI